MDIQGWLQDTADRALPDPSDAFDAPAPARLAHGVEATGATRYRRKCQRAASDSSLIAPRPQREGKAGQSAETGKARHVTRNVSRSVSASRDPSRSASQERGTHTRLKQPDSKTYERRARHKTRSDRYEPKTAKKGERKRRDTAGEHKPKRKRDRAQRSGDGKRTEDLVQGFRLKNGPSNSRLTLKPDAGAGFFKHGRSSAQMNGRGNGLPDLAFNELKFLRDSNEHQDEHQSHDIQHKQSKKEEKRDLEREEISAYFNQRVSHNEEHGVPFRTQTTRKQPAEVETLVDQENMQEGSSPILPNKDLPAIPYLGFGSKGAIHPSSKPHPSTTSYLTWSESAAGVASPKKHKLVLGATMVAGQLSAPRQVQMKRLKRDPRTTSTCDTTGPPRKNRPDTPRGQWATSRRIRGPAQVEVYTRPGIAELGPSKDEQELPDSTYQSLPTAQPRRHRRTQQQRTHAVDHAHMQSSGGETSHTSDILKVRTRLQALAEQPPSEPKSEKAPHSGKENINPSSSSPTAKILRIAHGAMLQNYRETVRQPPVINPQHRQFDIVEREHPFYSPAPDQHELSEPNMQGSTYGDFAHQHVPASPSLRGHYIAQQAWHDTREAQEDIIDPEDEEMLEVYQPAEPRNAGAMDTTGGRRFAFTHVPPNMHSDMHSLPYRYERPSTRARGVPWSRRGVSATLRGTSSHNKFAERNLSTREDAVVDQEFEDGLEGFWRPNRLY